MIQAHEIYKPIKYTNTREINHIATFTGTKQVITTKKEDYEKLPHPYLKIKNMELYGSKCAIVTLGITAVHQTTSLLNPYNR